MLLEQPLLVVRRILCVQLYDLAMRIPVASCKLLIPSRRTNNAVFMRTLLAVVAPMHIIHTLEEVAVVVVFIHS